MWFDNVKNIGVYRNGQDVAVQLIEDGSRSADFTLTYELALVLIERLVAVAQQIEDA